MSSIASPSDFFSSRMALTRLSMCALQSLDTPSTIITSSCMNNGRFDPGDEPGNQAEETKEEPIYAVATAC